MQKPKIVYIAVDDDDYELPFAVGDTMRELAEAVGVSPQNIRDCVRNRGRGGYTLASYISCRKNQTRLRCRGHSRFRRRHNSKCLCAALIPK